MSRIDEKALELSEKLKKELGAIELKTMEYNLADAMREGCMVSDQARNFGDGDTTCALSAAVLGAKARRYM